MSMSLCPWNTEILGSFWRKKLFNTQPPGLSFFLVPLMLSTADPSMLPLSFPSPSQADLLPTPQSVDTQGRYCLFSIMSGLKKKLLFCFERVMLYLKNMGQGSKQGKLKLPPTPKPQLPLPTVSWVFCLLSESSICRPVPDVLF